MLLTIWLSTMEQGYGVRNLINVNSVSRPWVLYNCKVLGLTSPYVYQSQPHSQHFKILSSRVVLLLELSATITDKTLVTYINHTSFLPKHNSLSSFTTAYHFCVPPITTVKVYSSKEWLQHIHHQLPSWYSQVRV